MIQVVSIIVNILLNSSASPINLTYCISYCYPFPCYMLHMCNTNVKEGIRCKAKKEKYEISYDWISFLKTVVVLRIFLSLIMEAQGTI